MMQNPATKQTVEKKKVLSIAALFVFSTAIALFGVALSIYSLLNNVSFHVSNTNIHGAVFGIVIVFLGVRYVLSVRKLKKAVFKSESQFSWANFKRDKKKSAEKSR